MATNIRAGGGSTPAVRELAAAGVSFTEHPYPHDPDHPSYGLEAAQALGLEPSTVFKTLVADVDTALTVAVVPVTASLNLKALARACSAKKATLADPATAQRATGYVIGGISPLGQRVRHRTVVDASAAGLHVMYVSGGRRGFDIGLAPADLIALTDAIVADVAAPAR